MQSTSSTPDQKNSGFRRRKDAVGGFRSPLNSDLDKAVNSSDEERSSVDDDDFKMFVLRLNVVFIGLSLSFCRLSDSLKKQNLSWAEQVEEEDSKANLKAQKLRDRNIRSKRKLHLSEHQNKPLKDSNRSRPYQLPVESDTQVISRREKQINYGKKTSEYLNYTDKVKRNQRSSQDPRTPDKLQVCSRRSFDQQIRIWRRRLHEFDDEDKTTKNFNIDECLEAIAE
ncbi:DgyrCDS11888 [Dimorphilus gyrociliatus]|uniref:DgyrCDS11888 n=1 Tax=Dimorphilus gyrociliatus TaxID=2664684 RepID=A0A7I8W7B6_9ANNE|nr:DgyrCDS11888 [Dimorphilus gyrociliatus]